MHSISGWAFGAALLFSAAIGAGQQVQPAPPATSAPAPAEAKAEASVEQLIADLGSEDYRTREKAGRELTLRSEKVLPAMRAALAATDNPEVQRRLLVMVRKMDYDRLVTPKRITMSLKGKTVKEALDEISKQTGYKINYNGNGFNGMGGMGGGPGPVGPRSNEPKLNFDFDNVPFWQAVDKVAASNGCAVFNDYNDDDTIQVFNQDTINPFVAYAGPFRFVANNINWNGNMQLAGINRRGENQNRQEYINLGFQIQSEPKNPMLGIAHVDLMTAVDDLGGSLIPPQDPNNRVQYFGYGGMFRGHNTYGGVNLNRSNRAATAVKTLKARVGITLLSGAVPELVISDPLKVKEKTFTGRTMEIEFTQFAEVANNKGHYQFDLTAKKLGASENQRFQDFNWCNSVWQRIEVRDAAGNKYNTQNPNNFNNNGGVAKLTVTFGPENKGKGQTAKLGPPAKLIVNEWLSVVHEVTFEFKDIPLP